MGMLLYIEFEITLASFSTPCTPVTFSDILFLLKYSCRASSAGRGWQKMAAIRAGG